MEKNLIQVNKLNKRYVHSILFIFSSMNENNINQKNKKYILKSININV